MSPLRQLQTLVDHGASDSKVDAAIIERQLRTAEALRLRLRDQGAAILGDEVGMGKTFVALALLVEALAREPEKGAVILVPKPRLVDKWAADLRLYFQAAVRNKELARRLVGSVSKLDRGLQRQGKRAIVVGQQNLFMGKLGRADCVSTLRAYLLERSGRTRMRYAPWLRACGFAGNTEQPGWTNAWADPKVFRRRPALLAPLDKCFEAYDNRDLIDQLELWEALAKIRRGVARHHLPRSALLVIDEAHHLRNTGTSKYQTMLEVLDQRFDSLLFLTATPFQMGPREICNVVSFSKSAVRGPTDARDNASPSFARSVTTMAAAMDDHVGALERFGNAWRDLDSEQAAEAVSVVDNGRPATEVVPQAAGTAELFRDALRTKEHVEQALTPFLVRSLQKRYRDEHPGLAHGVTVAESSRIPLALVDRMLYEVFDGGKQTFVASVLLGATSSFEALGASALMSREEPAGAYSRAQLRRMTPDFGPHPKVESTVAAAKTAIEANEKILIFVERTQTGAVLRRELDAWLENTTGSDAERLQGRRALQDRSRTGWAALRENYLQTVFPIVFGRDPRVRDLARLGRTHEGLFQNADSLSHPPRRDYSIEKRFWEHVLFADAVANAPGWRKGLRTPLLATVERILDDDYILNGLDLEEGSTGKPRRADPVARGDRAPQMDFARALVRYPSPWRAFRDELAAVDPNHRAHFVDAVARAIALSHLRVAFARADSAGSAASTFDGVMEIVGRQEWRYRLTSLVDQLVSAGRARADDADDLDPAQERVSRLISGLLSTDRVQFISGGSDPGTSQRAVQGFNTPMYPDVLIATDVLGEGIDLHRHCRRVVHHDLPWNPASLEQRTGRVDRIGSLSQHLREDGVTDSQIQVDTPFVAGTYDAFIHSQVMARERVFRWLLGSPPEWESDSLDSEEAPPPVPENWVKRLQIQLSPATG